MRRTWPFVSIVVVLTAILVLLVVVESPATPVVIYAVGGVLAMLYVARTIRSIRRGSAERIGREYVTIASSPAVTFVALQTGQSAPSFTPDAATPTMSVPHNPSPEALDLDRLEQERRAPEP